MGQAMKHNQIAILPAAIAILPVDIVPTILWHKQFLNAPIAAEEFPTCSHLQWMEWTQVDAMKTTLRVFAKDTQIRMEAAHK